MTERPIRWTRARWYRAKHLARFLPRCLQWHEGDQPAIVEAYHDAMHGRDQWWPSDPLLTPVRERLRRRRDPDDIPF